MTLERGGSILTDQQWSAGLDPLSDDTLAEVNHLWTLAKVLANTAHAVNNSLQVIAGNAELLASRPGVDPAVVRRLQTMSAQSERAAATIATLVSYSRAANTQAEDVDVGSLLDTLLDMRAHSLARARIATEIVRPAGGAPTARVPHRPLLQLLLNVMLVVESSVTGRAESKITIQLTPFAAGVTITVTGAGGGSSDEGDVVGHSLAWMEDRVLPYLAQSAGLTVEGKDASFTVTLPHG